MVVRRSRTVAAPVDEVWGIVRDPYHLPRWWPKTQRVERVSSSGWTSVLVTDRGRSVRADYRVEASRGERRRWSQELAETPFERLFGEVVYEIALAGADGGGTRVEIETRQKPRGWARFGGLMLRRAARRQLDEALSGLAGLVEGPA